MSADAELHRVSAVNCSASIESRNEPIFVVGVSRSGTTLLASMLGRHSRLYCGPETFFFPRLERQALATLLRPSTWPEPAVAFLSSMRLGQHGSRVADLFGRSVPDLHNYLARHPPSVRAMLESLAAASASAAGKARWVEKTPNHLLYLEEIRRHYPSAFILRIVRDPRDVALSLTGVPFGSRCKLANLYLWCERDERSWRFFESDDRALTVRYEDLLSDSESELRRVCAWMGELFEPSMLATNSDVSSMLAPEEWWKAQVMKPLDRSKVAGWLHKYSAGEAQVADLVCRAGLVRYGYPHGRAELQTCWISPFNRRFVEENQAILIDAATRAIAFRPLRSAESRQPIDQGSGPVVFWGTSRSLAPVFGKTVFQRVRSLCRLAALLCLQPIAGRVYWVNRANRAGEHPGKLDQVGAMLIRLLAAKIAPSDLFARVASTSAASEFSHHDAGGRRSAPVSDGSKSTGVLQ